MLYKRAYLEWLPVFVRSGASLGILVGVLTSYDCGKKEVFFHIVGYASMGVITGLLYPVTVPLSAMYVASRSVKN